MWCPVATASSLSDFIDFAKNASRTRRAAISTDSPLFCTTFACVPRKGMPSLFASDFTNWYSSFDSGRSPWSTWRTTNLFAAFFFFPPFVSRKASATESDPPLTASPILPDGRMDLFTFTLAHYTKKMIYYAAFV